MGRILPFAQLLRAPSAPRVIVSTPAATSYVPPAPVVTPTSDTTDNDSSGSTTTTGSVARPPGLPGTIHTSWRGLLDLNNNLPPRKSLLGE